MISRRRYPDMATNCEFASEMRMSFSMMMVAAPVFSKIVRYFSSELRSSSVRSRTRCSRVSFISCRSCLALLILFTRSWVQQLMSRMIRTVRTRLKWLPWSVRSK